MRGANQERLSQTNKLPLAISRIIRQLPKGKRRSAQCTVQSTDSPQANFVVEKPTTAVAERTNAGATIGGWQQWLHGSSADFAPAAHRRDAEDICSEVVSSLTQPRWLYRPERLIENNINAWLLRQYLRNKVTESTAGRKRGGRIRMG